MWKLMWHLVLQDQGWGKINLGYPKSVFSAMCYPVAMALPCGWKAQHSPLTRLRSDTKTSLSCSMSQICNALSNNSRKSLVKKRKGRRVTNMLKTVARKAWQHATPYFLSRCMLYTINKYMDYDYGSRRYFRNRKCR